MEPWPWPCTPAGGERGEDEGQLFGEFCRRTYLGLVEAKMETSFFGNLEQREMVDARRGFPETEFFEGFVEMARWVWLLHRLAKALADEGRGRGRSPWRTWRSARTRRWRRPRFLVVDPSQHSALLHSDSNYGENIFWGGGGKWQPGSAVAAWASYTMHAMVFFCFLVDQRRTVRSTKPAAGICSRCGGGAKVADMETATRFCYVPVHRRAWRAIICSFCGAVLKTYHHLISFRH